MNIQLCAVLPILRVVVLAYVVIAWASVGPIIWNHLNMCCLSLTETLLHGTWLYSGYNLTICTCIYCILFHCHDSISLFPQSKQINILFLFSMRSAFLDSSNKWELTVFPFLYLAHFTYSVSHAHLCHQKWQHILLFCSE